MNEQEPVAHPPPLKNRRGWLFYTCVTLGVIALVVGVTIGTASWWLHRQVHAKPFTPVHLSEPEQQVLDEKLQALAPAADQPSPEDAQRPDWVKQDEPATNVIVLTEKELNALLAKNTDLADKAYILIERDAIGARYNIPIDPDAPFLGGKTLRGRVQFGVTQAGDHVAVRITDVRVWGISLPNAWLGGLKGVDLFEELASGDEGLKSLSDGVESIRAEPGRLTIRLAE
jgi:hypothetical protein